MTDHRFRYVFGPVPSRRLGQSLGIDLFSGKHCSYDCVYCQVGRTPQTSIERGEWVPESDVRAEIELKLSTKPHIDYITFSGSGEPTLSTSLGSLLRWLRSRGEHKTAVLTNGSMLWHEGVRADLMEADLVVPSLDAVDETIWRTINRPAPQLDFLAVMDGLATFCNIFKREIWLEILLVASINDGEKHLSELAHKIHDLKVTRVQIHTVTRPPAESFAQASPMDRLERLASLIGDRAEIVMPRHDSVEPQGTVTPQQVIDMVARRPCTAEDIAIGLSIHTIEAVKIAESLLAKGELTAHLQDGRRYYGVR